MSDYNNQMVKVVSMSSPHVVKHVPLDETPGFFAGLSDGRVALTASNKALFFLDVRGQVTVQSRIRTARRYVGVADGRGDKTLIVSCGKDDDGPACVDVIRHDGRMVRRIVDDKTLTQLRKPLAICVMDNHVMIPDPIHDCVYRVEVTTGLLVDTFTHPHLKKPIQVVADGQGNLYMASRNRQNVLVLTASGQCTSLLQGPQHSDKDYVYPVSLCLTRAGLAVVWRNKQNICLVIDYSLT